MRKNELLEHGFDVSLDQCKQQRSSQTSWDQVEQGRLSMAVEMHDQNGGQQTQDVGSERNIEVKIAPSLQTANE